VRALAALALCGCAFHTSDRADAALAVDARPDGPPACLASGAWQVCIDRPTAEATLPRSINTSPGTADCTTLAGWGTNQPEACAIAATTITVASDTLVFGTRPLVLIATDTIAVSAVLDAASHEDATRSLGPGANPATCPAFASDPQNTSSDGGGGAGGTLTSKGADGGNGASGSSQGGHATAQNQPQPVALTGGCPGQRGGNGNGGGIGAAGRPGNGGGALYLVATNTITLADGALINVSGGGGEAGGFASGGGGGGSGGMIMLIAATITATNKAILVANGGAGAGGGTSSQNGAGAPDLDPTRPTTQQANVSGPGGDGGGGFAGTTLPDRGTDSGEGAGGGGGGAGYLQANEAFQGGTPVTSPTVVLQ